MPFAVTNFAELAYMMEVEDTMGHGGLPAVPDPATNPTQEQIAAASKKSIRYTGHSISKKSNFANSTEIRSDRQIVDAMRLGSTLDGDINFEFSADTYDDMLLGLMNPVSRDWLDAVDLTAIAIAEWSFDSSTGLLSLNAGSSNSPAANLQLGDWVRIGCTVALATNGSGTPYVGFGRVSSKNTATGAVSLTYVTDLPASITTRVAGVDAVLNVAYFTTFSVCTYLQNDGLKPKKYITFAFEDARTDLENTFFQFKHLKIVGLNLQVQSQSVITGSFNTMGTDMAITNSSMFASRNAIQSGTSVPMTATENVGVLYESTDSDGSEAKFKSVNLTITNTGRGQDVITKEYARDIALGTFNLTVSSQAYFMNTALYSKFVNNIETSMAFTFKGRDNAGNTACYIFDIPRLKITAATAVPTGLDQDQMVDLTMQSLKHLVLGYTFRISKFTY